MAASQTIVSTAGVGAKVDHRECAVAVRQGKRKCWGGGWPWMVVMMMGDGRQGPRSGMGRCPRVQGSRVQESDDRLGRVRAERDDERRTGTVPGIVL